MKTFIYALAVVATLSAAPAFAGLDDEAAIESNMPVYSLLPSLDDERGAGRIVNSEHDGLTEPADLGDVTLAPYPDSERPAFDGGR